MREELYKKIGDEVSAILDEDMKLEEVNVCCLSDAQTIRQSC